MANSSRVLRGTVWLLAAGIIAKILGAVFRIPLTSMLGGTGMGYYSSAYGLFLPMFALSVTGINTAVAALTAQYLAKSEPASAHRLYVLARRRFALIGTAAAVGLFFLAKPICTYVLRNPHAALAVQCFAPAVLICCLSAVLRGRFEGHQRMEPTAVSQIMEGFARVGFGLSFCAFALHHTADFLPFLPQNTGTDAFAAAAAILGVTVSALTGLVTVCFFRVPKVTDSAPRHTDKDILRSFFRLLIPVTAASFVTNLTGLLDLAAGLPVFAAAIQSEEQANFCFGAYSGLAVTMFNLVPSVTNALGKGVLPAFAESCTKHDRPAASQHAENVLRRTAFLACPAGLGLTVLSEPILNLLFSSRPQEIAVATPSLRILGIAVIFTALSFPLFSMMQGAGFGSEPVKVMLLGAAVKLPCNLFLIPRIGLSGAAWATLFCYLVILLAAVRRFRKCTGLPCPLLRSAAKPLFAGILCAATAHLLISHIALPFAVMGGGAVYLLAMFLLQ